eukprot:3805160-Pyramimonas_sp.AAC.1
MIIPRSEMHGLLGRQGIGLDEGAIGALGDQTRRVWRRNRGTWLNSVYCHSRCEGTPMLVEE